MQGWVRKNPHSSVAGVFAISFLLLFLLMDRMLNTFDEGLILVDAIRTLHGDIIHRDFYTPYGPGSNYILAYLFRIDPHWFILGRIYGIATMAGTVAAVFGLLVSRTRLTVALVFTAICGTWMLASPFYLYPLFPSVLLVLIGSAALLRWFETERLSYLLLAGMTAGATALFRYDAGFFLAIAHLAALAISTYVFARRDHPRPLAIAHLSALYAAGTSIVFLPVAISFLSTAPIAAFAADIVDYPLHYYAAMRGLPFPRPNELAHNPGALGVYTPILAVLLACIQLTRTQCEAEGSKPSDSGDSLRMFLVVFSLLAAILYYKGVVRVSSLHMLMSIVPSLLVLAVVVDQLWGERSSRRVVAALIIGIALVPPAFAAKRRGGWKERTPLGEILAYSGLIREKVANDASCPSVPATMWAWQDPDYHRVSEYIRKLSRPDEKIFVGLNRHDKIFVNPVSLYFSADRRPGTHWHQFDPGLQTRVDIQKNIISDLQANNVRWVIRDASFEEVSEPNLSRQSSGVHDLDRYIDGNYRIVASSGKVQIWLENKYIAPRQLIRLICSSARAYR